MSSEAPPRRSSMMPLLLMVGAMFVMLNPTIRDGMGRAVGAVLDPLVGFDGRFPVVTLVIGATILVLCTSVVRHFTTDWLAMARAQAMMRHFQAEFSKARKENNTYRIKKLQDAQPKMMEAQQKVQMASMKSMPFTLLIALPLFAWMFLFVDRLDYWWFSAPWNATIDMFTTNGILFGSSVLPHWILLYSALTIPFGALVQKSMKYLSWKERWKQRHPEVHE